MAPPSLQRYGKIVITTDYSYNPINSPDELEDLRALSNLTVSNLTMDSGEPILIYPDSLSEYDVNFGNNRICEIDDDGKYLKTNKIVGFIGRNHTHLSIHSRFSKGKKDYFLHYMLQKVLAINIMNLNHSTDNDEIFDFMVYLFPLYLKRALRQGLYRKYVNHRHNDAKAKGNIDLNRHIRNNVPFNGKIAYTTREYDSDNHITQLIRHTIEYLKQSHIGSIILNSDEETHKAVAQIIELTPTYQLRQREQVIARNNTPAPHPYLTQYYFLQKLCKQILKHEELKYGSECDEIYGVLIDAAWLWEEYLATIIAPVFTHLKQATGQRFFLFKRSDGREFQQIIPDYISHDKRIVADAKYIPLDKADTFTEEKATAIYYKTITYMYRFGSDIGYLLYPHPDSEPQKIILKINTETDSGASIVKLGLRIPNPILCKSYASFVTLMQRYEKDFLLFLCNK